MKQSLSFGTKLMSGFIIVALITLGVGFVGWKGTSDLKDSIDDIGEDALPSTYHVLTVQESSAGIKAAIRTLLNQNLNKEAHDRQYGQIQTNREKMGKSVKALEALAKTDSDKAWMKKITDGIAEVRRENGVVIEQSKALDSLDIHNPVVLRGDVEKFTGDHYKLLNSVADLLLSDVQFEGGEDHTQCAFGKWLAGFKTGNAKLNDILGIIKDHHQHFHASVKNIKSIVAQGDKNAAIDLYHKEMIPSAKATIESFGTIKEIVSEAVAQFTKVEEQAMGPATVKLNLFTELLDKIAQQEIQSGFDNVKTAEGMASRTRIYTLIGMIGGVFMALGLGIALVFSLMRPLRRVIEGIEGSADQVATASSQVSSASQQLAEGSSEQAASIEETSSSLEEMSSMTKQNADNADQANKLIAGTKDVVSLASQSMERLTNSMLEISKASEETSKIIKTIDEIAFQTNLLALNAAVEAARAGEAGAGFAVVADEVRNLAMRAADAAKNTADLIEGTVKKVKEGSTFVQKT
jgi:hypothetical protein